jgi:hypothetical protein
MQSPSALPRTRSTGPLDGTRSGDHDVPYRFGRTSRSSGTYPFSTRQYARLLVLRSRVRSGLFGTPDLAGDVIVAMRWAAALRIPQRSTRVGTIGGVSSASLLGFSPGVATGSRSRT